MEVTDLNYGKIAYEAYLKFTGGVSAITGEKLPTWEEQGPMVQRAWIAAANAVIGAYQPEAR